MHTDPVNSTPSDEYAGGFVAGLLACRLWHLQYAQSDAFFRRAIPNQVPDIVYEILSRVCRSALDERLFARRGFADVDALLLCSTERELRSVLVALPDGRIQ